MLMSRTASSVALINVILLAKIPLRLTENYGFRKLYKIMLTFTQFVISGSSGNFRKIKKKYTWWSHFSMK